MRKIVNAARKNWLEEKRSAYLYRELASIETHPVHKKLFSDLAAMAEKQAALWKQQLQQSDASLPNYRPDLQVRLILWLSRRFGVQSLKVALGAMKIRGMSIYRVAAHGHPMPSVPDEMEGRHRTMQKGNNIRAAVFGINDGLVSNLGLILGIIGAHVDQKMLLLTGIAGLLAGAFSMGSGEYISVRSQREILEHQLELERSELELYPEEEAMELALIYQARGLPPDEALKVAKLLIQDPENALNTLAREELGINPNDLMSPWSAALFSFVSFAIGAFVPLVPFIFSDDKSTIAMTIGLTAVALFMTGAIMSLFTQRSLLWSGLRMLLIGAGAGAVTFGIGSLFKI